MKKMYLKYFLLLIPAVLAYLALDGFGFLFKSGTAGAGILILVFYFITLFPVIDGGSMKIAVLIYLLLPSCYGAHVVITFALIKRSNQ